MREPSDVLKFPLLHLDDRKDWSQWLEAAGVVDAELSHGPVLNRASMVIDAAVDGQGVALARTTLAAWDLINGRLERPFAAASAIVQDATGSSAPRRRRCYPKSRRSAIGCWARPRMICAACRRSHRASEFSCFERRKRKGVGAPPSGPQQANHRLPVNQRGWNQGERVRRAGQAIRQAKARAGGSFRYSMMTGSSPDCLIMASVLRDVPQSGL